jgi:hypothetical protein
MNNVTNRSREFQFWTSYLWTPCNMILLQTLVTVKKLPASYGARSPLPCSQEPAIGPYPEPDTSCPHHHNLFKIHFNIIFSPTPSLPSGISSSRFSEPPECQTVGPPKPKISASWNYMEISQNWPKLPYAIRDGLGAWYFVKSSVTLGSLMLEIAVYIEVKLSRTGPQA